MNSDIEEVIEEEINDENCIVTEKITKPALQRLLRRAGVKRTSEPVFNILRHVVQIYLDQIIKKIIVFVKVSKRKTMQLEDLYIALENMNVYLVAGINVKSKNPGKTLMSCNSIGKSGPVKKVSKSVEEEEPKKHKKSGNSAIQSINYHQKNSDCLAIPKENFKRLVKQISIDYMEDIRFSEGVIDLLQLVVEDFVISISEKAYKCTIFDKRDTIHLKDIELVLEIINFDYKN
jgi:histone H3/H4